MNFQFKTGAFLGSILLIQLEYMFTILVIIAIGLFGEAIGLEFFKTLGLIVGIALFLIFLIGHVKTSVAVLRDFTDPTAVEKDPDAPKTFQEALNISENPITKGVIWRFKREVDFIKEIANLNFKYKD